MESQSDSSMEEKSSHVTRGGNGRIAVVIPSYNHAHFLPETLDSVLQQSRPADRILVLDDGSRDASLEVLEGYKAKGVEVYSQDNQGAHHTLNRLIEMASEDCEFVAILNSDDRYLPNRLQSCWAALRENSSAQIATTSLQVLQGEEATSVLIASSESWFQQAWKVGSREGIGLSGWLGQANFLVTTSNIFARSSYLISHPFGEYRYVHDYYFLILAALKQELLVLPEVALQYRVHATNTIKEKSELLMRELVRMNLDLYRNLAGDLAIDEPMRLRFYEYALNSWGSISSFHAGLMQWALASLVHQTPEHVIARVVEELRGFEFEKPPKAIALSIEDGSQHQDYARFVDELKVQNKPQCAKCSIGETWLDYKEVIVQSQWLALACLLGGLRGLKDVKGKPGQQRFDEYKEACRASRWVQWGARLGSKSCRALLAEV